MKPNEIPPTSPASESATSASSPPLLEGEKLAGVYVLRQQLAAGDFEAVWLAQDEVLGKDVALHFLPAAVRGDSRAMSELRQELKRNRQLIHPNILRVYDLVEEDGWAAVAMDAFEGESLASLLAKKEGQFFEPGEVKGWLAQLCQTLEDVHKIQLVHRNVSPANLVISASGKLLMTNFGISRVMEDARGRSKAKDAKAPRHLAYTNPQQLDGEPPNRADDFYAIGATIYELLTGEPPFAGGEMVSQIRKGTSQPMMERRAKLGKRGGTILPTWEKAVAACLAKNPAERPASALELATKLGLGKLGAEKAAELAIAAPVAAPAAAVVVQDAPARQPEPSAPGPALPAKKVESDPAEKERKKKELIRVEKVAAKTPGAGPAEKPVRDSDKKVAKEEAVDLDASGVPDIYPSLYPQRSRFPLTGVAVAVVLAGVGLSAYHFNWQAQNGEGALVDAPTTRAADTGELALVNNASQPPLDPEAAPSSRAALPPRGAASAEPSGSHNAAAGAPAAIPEPPRAPDSSAVAAISDRIGAPASPGATKQEPIVVAARTPKRGSTPAPATPAPATSAPASSREAAPLPSIGSAGDAAADPEVAQKRAELERARQAADAAEKAAQDARKQQQQSEAALADAQKAFEEKSKALTPASKAAEELEAQRKQREEEQKVAELAAQQARQAAEEKTRQAEAAKKVLAEWDAQNKAKLAAKQKADAEMQTLQASLSEKQRAAENAARMAAEADTARQQRIAALRQVEGEAEQVRLAAETRRAAEAEARRAAEAEARRMAEARAAQQAQIDKEIADMRKQFEQRLEELEKLRRGINSAPATATPATTTAPPPPPATNTRPAPSTPAPVPPPTTGAVTEPAPTLPSTAVPPTTVAEIAKLTPPTQPNLAPPPEPAPATPTSPASPEASNLAENSLGMRFAPIPGVDALFSIWPTRVKDFEVFAKEVNLKSTTWRAPGFKQGPDHPVVNVTWNEAIAFCRWLTDRERKSGALAKTEGYRLPTDLEWSKAVGLPEESGKTPEARDMMVPDVFPWGTQWPPPPNSGNYTGEETGSDVAIKNYDDGFAWTSPVGSFPANQFGLYDMGGNVWQWCMDSWNSDTKARVLRGASWYNGAIKFSLLSSCRVSANPDNSTDNYGFRVVRAPESGRSARR